MGGGSFIALQKTKRRQERRGKVSRKASPLVEGESEGPGRRLLG